MNRWIGCLIGLLLSSMTLAQNPEPQREGSKYGFRQNNAWLITPQYEYATHFQRGMALVKSEGKWGYINLSGNWVITPQFDLAQPFAQPYAYVRKNGKAGIIDSTGRFWLQPEYDQITEDWSGFMLTIGDKKGYLRKDAEAHLIPAIYQDIKLLYGVDVGKIGDQNYDLYIDGKKALSGLKEPVTNNDIKYFYRHILLHENGNFGIYHFKKGLIVPIRYKQIEEIPCPDYQVEGDDHTYSRIFALHTRCQNCDVIDEADLLTDSIVLIREDGTVLNDVSFNRIQQLYDADIAIQTAQILKAWKGEKMYLMDNQFQIAPSRYSYLDQHLSWFIAADEHKSYILNENKVAIDSFDNVNRHVQNMFVFDYETGDEYWSEATITNEPYLIVTKLMADKSAMLAVYDLNLERTISPWMPSIGYVNRQNTEFGPVIYTYGPNVDTTGFFVEGMKEGSAPIYGNVPSYVHYLKNSNSFFFSKWNLNNQSYDFYSGNGDTLKFLGKFDDIQGSYTWSKDTTLIDSVSFEPQFEHMELFRKNFLILRNKDKYGILCDNGTLIQPIYDTLIDSPHNFIISTMIGGLYGSVDIENGKTIMPFSKEPLQWRSDFIEETNRDDYVLVNAFTPQAYFLSSNGVKFRCHAADVYIDKKKRNKQYLIGYTELADQEHDGLPDTIASYRRIKYTMLNHIYQVQNKDKKWGLINFMGESIFPCEFDEIIDGEFDLNSDQYFLMVRKGKKFGIITLSGKTIVPVAFDAIRQLELNYEILPLFEVQNQKLKGIYGARGEMVLPCIMENLNMEYMGDNDGQLYTGQSKGKNYARVYSPFHINYYTQPLIPYDFKSNDLIYVKNGDNILEYDFTTGRIKRRMNINDFEMKGTSYAIFQRDGKFGAKDLEGNVLIEPIYDIAQFMEGRDEVMIGWEQGTKYYIYVFTKDRYTENQW